MDFFNIEVMTLTGPVRYSVLVVMDLKTCHVEVAGMDRDPIVTAGVRSMLMHAGAKPVRLPRRSPNLNAFVESYLRSRIRQRGLT